MEKGAEDTRHGGAATEARPPGPCGECVGGQMRNQLLTVCLQLTPAPAGAGGFCAVPEPQVELLVPPALATSRTTNWRSTQQPALDAATS